MKVYDKNKTKILTEYDLEKGHLKEDFIIHHHKEIQERKEVGHEEVIAEYDNGGKSVRWVVDIPYTPPQPARDEEEEIYVYIPYTEEELLENKKNSLRAKREAKCFSIINRGSLWYDKLSGHQLEELEEWYQKWLDVTETLEAPETPEWLK